VRAKLTLATDDHMPSPTTAATAAVPQRHVPSRESPTATTSRYGMMATAMYRMASAFDVTTPAAKANTTVTTASHGNATSTARRPLTAAMTPTTATSSNSSSHGPLTAPNPIVGAVSATIMSSMPGRPDHGVAVWALWNSSVGTHGRNSTTPPASPASAASRTRRSSRGAMTRPA